jgi:hypothetical protein
MKGKCFREGGGEEALSSSYRAVDPYVRVRLMKTK